MGNNTIKEEKKEGNERIKKTYKISEKKKKEKRVGK